MTLAAKRKIEAEEPARPQAEIQPTSRTRRAAGQKKPAKLFKCSIEMPGCSDMTPQFANAIEDLEATLKMPVWLLIQDGNDKSGQLNELVTKRFFESRRDLKRKEPVALVIDSPGGSAKCAFQIASLLRRHCGGFHAVVPRYAKSAATLLTLGADSILLGTYAELGPLDAQLIDFEREDITSALDEVQTLERLHAFAMEAVDQTMMLLAARTGKKVDTLLPLTMRFVSDMMRPMLEKVDVVHFTQLARLLKVAEEYAIRLLQPKYGKEQAEQIARRLVERYPEHGFIIDAEELSNSELQLETLRPTEQQELLLDKIGGFLESVTFLGRIQERKTS